MVEVNREEISLVSSNDKIAKNANIISIFQALFGFGTLVLAGFATCYAKGAWREAKRGVSVTRDIGQKQTQAYFDILVNKLSDKGVIIVDDILWRGEVLDPQDKRAKALDDFNKYVNLREDVETLVLPIRHGVNVIRKVI